MTRGSDTSEFMGTIFVHLVAIFVHLAAIGIVIFGGHPWAMALNGAALAIQAWVQRSYNASRTQVKTWGAGGDAALYLALLTALAIGGCKASPNQRYYAATQLYATTLESLATARELGQIDDGAYAKIEQYRRAAAAALDQMAMAAAVKDESALETAVKMFEAAMKEMQARRHEGT